MSRRAERFVLEFQEQCPEVRFNLNEQAALAQLTDKLVDQVWLDTIERLEYFRKSGL